MSASSNSFASTVDLSLQPSHRALRAIFLLHILCLGLLPFSMQQGWPMLVLAFAFALSWLFVRRHAALGFSAQAVTRLVWHADDSWTVYRGRGGPVDAELLPGSLVHPWLLLLRFRLKSGSTTARLIAGDEVSVDGLRRLRARLSLSE